MRFESPLEVKAFLYDQLNVCACSELTPIIATLRQLLEWGMAIGHNRQSYDIVFKDIGAFYLLSGRLEELDIMEHGTSIRCAWLTQDGQQLLSALYAFSSAEIEQANGEFNGVVYQ